MPRVQQERHEEHFHEPVTGMDKAKLPGQVIPHDSARQLHEIKGKP
jgi:hypothetical protein